MQFKVDTDAPPSKCKGCGAAIWWIESVTTGKKMPVNKDGTSHFSNCPKAVEFRRKR